MKVGIISFEEALTCKTLRGVSTTTRYLQEGLKSVGVESELIIYSKAKIIDYPSGFNIVNHCRNLEDLKELKNHYDFIVYYTPGRSWEKYDEKDPDRYIDVLDAVGIPFTTFYHSEEYRVHQPYRMNFLHHKDCKFLIFVSDFKEIYAEDLEIIPDYTVAMSMPMLKDINELISYQKSNSIIMTSVWTNFKRNLEYFELTSRFNELGIKPYSAGAPNSNFYMNDILDLVVSRIDLVYDENHMSSPDTIHKYRDYQSMMARLKQEFPYQYKKGEESSIPLVKGAYIYDKEGNSWYDYGAYFPEEMDSIMMDKKFHWNMSGYKIKSKAYSPRIETVTMEAFNRGCLPVLCKETTPEWIVGGAFRFSMKDYADHLEELRDLTEDQRIQRLRDFYELVQDNLYNGMYEAIRDRMEAYSHE